MSLSLKKNKAGGKSFLDTGQSHVSRAIVRLDFTRSMSLETETEKEAQITTQAFQKLAENLR